MLNNIPRALAWGFSLYVIGKIMLGCCGKDVQKAAVFSTFQSDVTWALDDEQVRIVARTHVQLKTRFGNLRLGAGAHSNIPVQIANDLIANEAPIWIV